MKKTVVILFLAISLVSAGIIAKDRGASGLYSPPPPPPPDPVFSESCVQKELSQAIVFPAELAGTEATGVVHVLLIVNPCGEVKRAVLDRTSGNPILDKAAIEAVLKWVLSPASLGFDKGQGGLVSVPVTFMETARP